MRAALWLAARELRVRWRRVTLAAAAVAALAAAATTLELLGRAREEAVAARVDAMGPALTVVPAGVGAGELARHELGGRQLPADAAARVERALGAELRGVERRLVVRRTVAGLDVPVLGVEEGEGPPPAGAALAGAELARRLGDAAAVELDGRTLRLAGARPSTGDADDLALVLPLAVVQALEAAPGAASALRLYLRAGVSPRAAEARLAAAGLDAAVIRHDRGDVAGGELQGSLARHRRVAQGVMALVAALCLLVVAHLDAAERRVEIATLVAIGAPRAAIMGALVGRSALVAAAGAAAGIAAGYALAAAQDPAVAGALSRHWAVGAGALAAAVGLAVLAAAPTGVAEACRDPVPSLQEA